MEKLNVAFVGLSCRGRSLMKTILKFIPDVHIVAVCDLYEDRVQNAIALCEERCGYKPLYSDTDYRKIIDKPEVDCVIIATAWDSHIQIAIDCMNIGKYVASEVKDIEVHAFSLDESEALLAFLKELVAEGDTVLYKASNGIRLGRFIV